jgi:hypothetical protein
MLLGLRDDDADDTIPHSGLNMVLIDADIEAERMGKLANPSLRYPVLLFELLSLQRLGDSGAGLFVRSVFIFNGYLACLDALPLLSANAVGHRMEQLASVPRKFLALFSMVDLRQTLH